MRARRRATAAVSLQHMAICVSEFPAIQSKYHQKPIRMAFPGHSRIARNHSISRGKVINRKNYLKLVRTVRRKGWQRRLFCQLTRRTATARKPPFPSAFPPENRMGHCPATGPASLSPCTDKKCIRWRINEENSSATSAKSAAIIKFDRPLSLARIHNRRFV